jgi:hypothetical protein
MGCIVTNAAQRQRIREMGAASNPVRAARRQTEHHERLGSEHAICFYCGFPEPVALRRASRRFLDEHHPVGRNHDPNLTIFLCRNCHALAHEQLLDAGVELKTALNPVGRAASMLRAQAVHFERLARTNRELAALLETEKS